MKMKELSQKQIERNIRKAQNKRSRDIERALGLPRGWYNNLQERRKTDEY